MDKSEIYIQEACLQITFAKKAFTDYEMARDAHEIPTVFLHVHHFVAHASNVDKLLSPRLDSLRAKLLSSHFDLSSINLKNLRRLRNHLEHFDERIDDWVRNYDGHALFDMNIVTGAKGFPDKMFLRALDGDVYKFYGESFDIAVLNREIESVASLLKCSQHK